MAVTIEKSTIKFLNDLAKNNNRDWFKKNKERYDAAYANAKEFMAAVEQAMQKHDVIEKSKLFRVHRDVRFSKDKTPYNTDLRFSFTREGAYRRGGYYLKIGPKDAFIAGGFWRPEPKDLKLIRSHLAADAKPLRKILASKKFKDNFGIIEGEKVKSAPKGYSKDHPNIDLLRHKSFIIDKKIDKKLVTSKDLIKEVNTGFKAARPYFNYMTEILTHDLNGERLYS